MSKTRTRALVVLGLLFLAWLSHRPLVELAVDALWFESVGFSQVFTTRLGAQVGLWLAGLVLGAGFAFLNLALATREANIEFGRASRVLTEGQMPSTRLRGAFRLGVAGWLLLVGLATAGALSSGWLTLLSGLHGGPFGEVDPVFGLELSFHVFELPAIQLLRGGGLVLLFLTTAPLAGFYMLRDVVVGARAITARAARHLAGLTGAWLLLVSVGWYLDRYELLREHRGAVWGVGYADEHVAIPALTALAVIGVLAAIGLQVAAWREKSSVAVGSAGLLALAWLVCTTAPRLVHNVIVTPSEITMEEPYILRNIEGTRRAFGLDRVQAQAFESESGLTAEDLLDNPETLENVRIWDHRPLLQTFGQLQEIRLYYDFVDVDIDRYELNGRTRQVMLSARELEVDNVPGRSWINEHFSYTHGYGLTMSPVNAVTAEGLPELFVQDLPPRSSVDIEITRPEIYFGELTDRYVFIGTEVDEFDYPDGDENVYSRYDGRAGVSLQGMGRKLLFSLYFSSLDVLLSQYLDEDSRVLFRRRITDRIQRVAPYLVLDDDPYLVVADGRLYWMVDGYTVSDRYPYSEPAFGGLNYIRNSVQVVVDAYEGSVQLFVSDPDDPLLQTYGRVFPGSLSPLEDMPESLVGHIRYPEDLFDVQAELYLSYHMTDPTTFYNREDQWEFPQELYGAQPQAMEAYYLVMSLPEQDRAEFILLRPFVPKGKDNMVSWLAARSDPPHYGDLVLYQFPKKKLVYGPRQIEARIDQDPDISQEITLWSTAGSNVVRGNLLVIPVNSSLLYVEPLYLQAASGQLPELKRVIVSYENAIAMAPTLDGALAQVFGAAEAPKVQLEPGQEPPPRVDFAGPLVEEAARLYALAVERQREGDWAGYGRAIDELGGILEQMSEGLEAPEAEVPQDL